MGTTSRVAVAVVTMGNRPAEVDALLESVAKQDVAPARIVYAPELLLRHPKTSPARHAIYFRVNARNRVWLARRRLPLVLVPVHLGVWMLLTVLRNRSVRGLRAWFGGFVEGLREPAGERRPMRWRTVWRLTRLGRPPVI